MAKYHNFRQSGSYYTSKAGHDSNPGTDPNAPKKTIFSVNALQVIGAGEYTLTANQTFSEWLADGEAVIECNGFGPGANSNRIEGFELRNVDFRSTTNAGNKLVTQCVLRNPTGGNIGGGGGPRNFSNNIITGTTSLAMGGAGSANYSYNVITGGMTVYAGRSSDNSGFFLSNYLGKADKVIYYGPASGFRNNNLQGLIGLVCANSAVRYFAVQDQLAGSPQDHGYDAAVQWLTETNLTAAGYTGTVAGWNTAVASCLNRTPRFVDPQADNYSLQADSPHIRRAHDGASNIGGTRVGFSVSNADDGSASGTRVLPSPGIDTSNPNAFILKAGETEAYVDYVFPLPGLPLTELDVSDLFNFNTDFAGGSIQNSNVVDAEPRTSEYARFLPTVAAATDASTLRVAAGAVQVGQHVWVNGQGREVIYKATSGATDTLTLSSPLLAPIGAGVDVTFGTEQQLAALNPNRLTNWFRTRSSAEPPSIPMVDAEWDNEVHASYGVAGRFFNQELGAKPGLIVYNGQVWGAGDSAAPVGVQASEIAGMWGNCRVFKRNNQSSKGLSWQG